MKQITSITTLWLLWSALCYGQPLTPPSSIVTCSDLAIQLKTPNGQNTFYAISYCNIGEGLAENSYLEIQLDNDLSIAQATQPLQYKSGEIYRFLIGDIEAGECGSMYFQIPQALIKAHCLQVFAATAVSCTAQNAALHVDRTGMNGNTTTTGSNTGITITQAEVDMTRTTAGTDYDPIFEDHVFLDFVPTWDSLMRMFADLQTYTFDPNDSVSAGSSGVVVFPIEEELPLYATASYCRYQAAASTILTHHDGFGSDIETAEHTVNQATAIHNTFSDSESKTVRLFPNPAYQEAVIEATGYKFSNLQLEVYSATGQRVHYLESNDNRLVIPVQQWSKGVYFYRLYADGEMITTDRFVIQ